MDDTVEGVVLGWGPGTRELDLLLHEWLSELIVLKDSERLVFPEAVVSARIIIDI